MKVEREGACAAMAFCMLGLVATDLAQARDSLNDKVTTLLKTKGDVVSEFPNAKCMGFFHTHHICEEQFIVKNITMEQEGAIKFGDMTSVAHPNNAVVWDEIAHNCTDGKGTMAIALGKQIARQVTKTVTQQYALMTGATASMGISTPFINIASLSGSLTIQGTITKIDADADAKTETDTTTGTVNHDLAPHSRTVAHASVTPKTFTVPFTVDGTFDAEIENSDTVTNPNWQHLSEIFPLKKMRWITFKGEIVVTQATHGRASFKEKIFHTDEECIQDDEKANVP